MMFHLDLSEFFESQIFKSRAVHSQDWTEGKTPIFCAKGQLLLALSMMNPTGGGSARIKRVLFFSVVVIFYFCFFFGGGQGTILGLLSRKQKGKSSILGFPPRLLWVF